MARYGVIGRRLAHFSHGIDYRPVQPNAPTKSISSETTLGVDERTVDRLSAVLWPLCQSVARRLTDAGLAGNQVTMKLKTTDFRIRTRNRRLMEATQRAAILYETALPMLESEADGTAFRLIGVGASALTRPDDVDIPDLFEQ